MNKKDAMQIYKEETGKDWFREYENEDNRTITEETGDYIEWLEEKVEFYYND